MSEFRPDFFDLRLALPSELLEPLKKVSHLLQDQFGNTISSFNPDLASGYSEPLLLEGKPVAPLRRGSSHDAMALKNLLQSAMAQEFRALHARNDSEAQTLITRDLSTL
ncbi:MAG: hypothetical protein ACXWQO_03310, partial [Bdellovibrionota bacterium]